MKYLFSDEAPPRKGKNVITLSNTMDLSISVFIFGWQTCCKLKKKLLWPKSIVIVDQPLTLANSLYFLNFIEAADMLFSVTCLNNLEEKNNPDEWWITFQDSDIVFYSAGA